MTTTCTNCGTTDGPFVNDPLAGARCLDCGVGRPTGGYVSPGQYERNAEAIDHAAVRHRQRVVENGVNE